MWYIACVTLNDASLSLQSIEGCVESQETQTVPEERFAQTE